MIDMSNTIIQLCEFSTVPAIGSANQISCDALKLIDMLTATLRTNLKIIIGILLATVHATIAIVVH